MNIFNKIGCDIAILAKNFIHWNISKIIITIYCILLGFFGALPFLLLGLGFYYINSETIYKLSSSLILYGQNKELNTALFQNIYNFILDNILVIGTLCIIILTSICVFIALFSYKYVLMNNLYMNYLKGVKLGFFDKIYKDFGKIKKFILISAITSTIFILYLILLFILMFLLYRIGNYNDFYVLNIVLRGGFFLISSIITYLMYRVYFSFLIFLDEKYENLSVIESIKKSIEITKGLYNFLKVLAISLIFLVYFILFLILEYFIGKGNLYSIIEFLFLDGVFGMILASFYNNVLTKNNFEEKEEKNVIVEENTNN